MPGISTPLPYPPPTHTQTHLPERLRVVSVSDGVALLRAEGLYTARVTLTPLLDVPDAPSVLEQRRGGGGGGGGPSGSGATTAGHEAGATGAGTGTQPMVVDGEDEDEDVTSGPKPRRWLWLLLGFELLPNSCLRQALAEAQTMHLLQVWGWGR